VLPGGLDLDLDQQIVRELNRRLHEAIFPSNHLSCKLVREIAVKEFS
jgi:hypothetical protein